MFDKNGYYNTNKIKSYDARFYIVASERGLGKTYGEKKALFRNYIRRGHRFACIFRTGSDMSDALKNWLSPLTDPSPLDKSKPVPREDFNWINRNASGTSAELEYKGNVIGYFRCLSIANSVKYETFPLDISEVFFDEFAPVVYKKIGGVDNEGEALEIIIDTMDHDSRHRKTTLHNPNDRRTLKDPKKRYNYPKIKTVMFCNPRNRTSPLYDYFHIPALKFGIHRVNRDVVCEQIEPFYEDTEGGLDNSARKCTAWLETTSYIKKVPKGSHPVYSMRFKRHYYTSYSDGRVTVIKRCKEHTNGAVRYFGTLDYLSEYEISLDYEFSEGKIKKWLLDQLNAGINYYESTETKYSYIQDLLDI